MKAQKVNAKEGDTVTMFVVTRVKKRKGEIYSYEYSPEYIKIEK